ncbi:heterokaryon incompatibility protein-domain-containing protein [Phyllosticta citricarpa]
MVPSGGGPYFTLRTKHALSTDNLEKPVFYTALSYTWGSGGFDCEIECDGGSLPITASLNAALRHFRQKDHSVVMWIDQICINQNDGEEKKQQIPLMSKIYSRAMNTAVWLGEGIDRRGDVSGASINTWKIKNDEEEDEDGILVAFDLLRQIRVILQFNEDSVGPQDLPRLALPDEHAEAWKVLRALFTRPWFQRLWVIQEAILSESPWMVCGTRQWTANPTLTAMSFDEFTNACSTLHLSGIGKLAALNGDDGTDGGDQLASGSGMVLNLSYQRESFWQAESDLSLLETLIFTRYARCYFAHDKIYGLLGVCGQRGIAIDYERPPAALYRDVAVMFLTEAIHHLEIVKKHPYSTDMRVSLRDVFDVLICVDHEPADTDASNEVWSSWVPDWQRPRVTESLGHSTSTLALYQAGGTLDPQLRISADRRTLTLRGKIVDFVSNLSPAFAAPYLGLPPSKTRANDLLTCQTMARRRHPSCPVSKPCACSPRCHYVGGTIFDAFWQTLVAGKDESGKQACPASWSLVFSLLLDAATGAPYALPDQTYDKRQLLPDGHPGKVTVAHLGSWGSEDGGERKQQQQAELITTPTTTKQNSGTTGKKKKPSKRGGAIDFNNRKLARSFHAAQTAAQRAMRNRHFGVTGEKKLFGLFPHHARVGDIVAVFAGCHVPFVLRRRQGKGKGKEDGTTWQLVGECYVQGIMRGEGLTAVGGEEGRLDEIVLV